MVMDQNVLKVKSFFTSREIPLSNFWLESCIKWYREQNPSETCSEMQLRNVVYEQWLLLDLREVEISSLPPRLREHKKFVFNGTFYVQMLCVVDISKPKHWQLAKIRNANALTNVIENDKDVVTSKRMLQMTLTDGVQEVDAMEYRFVSCLNVNLSPGIKIRLIGPLTVRRGKIMLEEKNVQILGGEVEEIQVSNATENVLARHLGLSENPNPVPVNTNLLCPSLEDTVTNKSNVVQTKGNDRYQAKTMQVRPATSVACIEDDIDEEEELRIAQEVEMLMEQGGAGPSRTVNKQRTPDMFDDDLQSYDFDRIDEQTN